MASKCSKIQGWLAGISNVFCFFTENNHRTMKDASGFGSLCVHDLEDPRTTRPLQLPIYATTVFEFESVQQGIDIFQGKEKGHLYSRFGNPTVEMVAEKIGKMEGFGLESLPTSYLLSSGMAAISTLMLGVLKSGDKILTQGNLYGGTTELFIRVLQPLGFEIVYADFQNLDALEDVIKKDPAIRMLYFETPSNPTLACVDMEAIGSLCKKYGRFSAADNTFCTPYLQQPFRYGIDFVLHSTTKYLNGHGNSTAGILLGMNQELMQDGVFRALKLLGTNCNPFDAWLINNGLKTLELRMDRHSSNAMAIARFLQTHPAIAHVNYVGLPEHPDHPIAARQMSQFSGMLSFELKGGQDAAIAFIDKLQFCKLAPTMGDVETLVMHPVTMSHSRVAPEIRLQHGITDGLVRLSVGIETPEDILQDIEQALA